jgi:hypothetical protein
MVTKYSVNGYPFRTPPYTKEEWLEMWDSARDPPVTVGSTRPRAVPPPTAEPPPPEAPRPEPEQPAGDRPSRAHQK